MTPAPRHRFRPWSLLAAGLAASALGAPAQSPCMTQWQALPSAPLAVTAISTIASWDPDGPGPLSVRLVAGGGIPSVQGVAAGGVAVCDLATSQWSALAGGTDGRVDAIVAMPNGDLVVAGPFLSAGGVPAAGIARWNGSSWAPLGAGLAVAAGTLQVRSLVVASNGDLVALGNFTTAGGAPAASGLARWNGATWTALPAVVTGSNQNLYALAALPGGELAVGGDFTAIGGVAAGSIARWNGTAWLPLGAGFVGSVRALAVTGSGSLVAAASLQVGGQLVVQWTGSAWQTLASQPFSSVHHLVGLAGGVAAAGTFSSIGGVAANGVAAWDGAGWRAFGNGLPDPAATIPQVRGLAALPSGQLLALPNEGPFRWDGVAWRPLVLGALAVRQLLAEPDGSVLAAGSYMTTSGAANLARWVGGAFTPVPTPIQGIAALGRRNNGNLVVGGAQLAEYDGVAWSIAPSLSGSILALQALPNGDMLAGGSWFGSMGERLASWNGSSWAPFGASLDGTVRALALLPNGDVVAAGEFTGTVIGGGLFRIARWNGAQWAPFGSGVNATVRSLAVGANGDVFAAGDFTTAGGLAVAGVARWNGAAWSALPGMPPMRAFALTMLPGGDLIAAGHTPQSFNLRQPVVARWNGASWTDLSAGLAGQPGDYVFHAAFAGEGLFVSGGFENVGGAGARGFARLVSNCPATVQPFGAGCGGRTVQATTPWLGSTLRTTGSAPAGAAVAVVVNGFAPASVPLAAALPPSLPGCTLLVSPDFVVFATIAGGNASATLALPDVPALAGVVLRQQLVAIELGGAFLVTSSPALLLTLGSF